MKEKNPDHRANKKSKLHYVFITLLCFSLRWRGNLCCLSNHKITKWLRLEGIFECKPGPAIALKQSHLELVAQDHVQTLCKYLQGWRLHTLPEQPKFSCPHSEKVSPDDQMKPSFFPVVPIASPIYIFFYPVLT